MVDRLNAGIMTSLGLLTSPIDHDVIHFAPVVLAFSLSVLKGICEISLFDLSPLG